MEEHIGRTAFKRTMAARSSQDDTTAIPEDIRRRSQSTQHPLVHCFPLRKRAARAPSNREFLLACSGNAHWWGKRSACADCPLVDVNKKQSMRTRSYHATSETRPPPHLPSHPHQHDIQRYITFKMTPGNNKRKLEDMSEFVSLLNTCEVANQFHFVLRLLMRHCSWRRHR